MSGASRIRVYTAWSEYCFALIMEITLKTYIVLSNCFCNVKFGSHCIRKIMRFAVEDKLALLFGSFVLITHPMRERERKTELFEKYLSRHVKSFRGNYGESSVQDTAEKVTYYCTLTESLILLLAVRFRWYSE